MANMVDKVVDVMVVLLIGAILLPIGINQFTGVDTSSWDSNLITIWDNIPIIALVGVLLLIIFNFVRKPSNNM